MFTGIVFLLFLAGIAFAFPAFLGQRPRPVFKVAAVLCLLLTVLALAPIAAHLRD